MPVAFNLLLAEQHEQFIMDTVQTTLESSQASGVGKPSQQEKSRTPSEQRTNDQVPVGPAPASKEEIAQEPPEKEVPAYFRASSHLPTYNGIADLVEHFQLSTIFLYQFARSKKCQKSAINLFEVKQEENETLRAYIECFNQAILEVPATHLEVLISAIMQGLRNRPLLESLAKKPISDFYDLLARADRYINLEDAQLIKKDNPHDRRRDNEGFSCWRTQRTIYSP
ncbi:UNVERIFIED_CONTAM: hypothetical protein Slati_1385600 [Sesamum latifolium]|uniref:Retrotransposon gag domain-containing protein n=1 Tax=Sesamum latifolium TaxID=2727402 RepID=A0AAW2X6D0_9LAMI